MPGKAEQTTVTLSKDGSAFVAATNSPTEFATGYYTVELTDDELKVNEFAIINIVCPGAQKFVKQYTPSDLSELAKQVEALSAIAFETLAGMLNWQVVDNTLTTYDDNGDVRGQYTITKDSAGNIVKIEPIPSNNGN